MSRADPAPSTPRSTRTCGRSGRDKERLEETARRARAYGDASAGADSLFVPSVVDAATIGRLGGGMPFAEANGLFS